MEIKYLTHSDAAYFGEVIHSGSELAELFSVMTVLLDTDTDYDEVMVSFEDDEIMRVSVDDSPYVIVLDAATQVIILEQSNKCIVEEDFDEDGVESVVDVIASRILSKDYNA